MPVMSLPRCATGASSWIERVGNKSVYVRSHIAHHFFELGQIVLSDNEALDDGQVWSESLQAREFCARDCAMQLHDGHAQLLAEMVNVVGIMQIGDQDPIRGRLE